MTHIALLGDSVFDNAAYVAPGQEVVEKLRDHLESGWRVTLQAKDGAVIADVPHQAERLPPDASHLIISAGGNDALRNAWVLDEAVGSVGQAMARLADIQNEFRRDYARMLDHVLERGLPTMVCTIYDARFPDLERRRVANTALAVLNDVITREAAARGLHMLDLRVLFGQDADYANSIEPSAQGGEKLAHALIRATFVRGVLSFWPHLDAG